MCFMFGASKEQVHRALGLTGEAEHELTDVDETPVSVPAAEDRPQDQGSRSCPAEHCRA
jgi:hypothetical protein